MAVSGRWLLLLLHCVYLVSSLDNGMNNTCMVIADMAGEFFICSLPLTTPSLTQSTNRSRQVHLESCKKLQ